jgi:hypothetical protein
MNIKFEELLKKLQGLENIQKGIDWHDCIPWEIWMNYFDNNHFEVLEDELIIDKRRWYETSVTVVEIFGELLGIRHISQLYSESGDVESCFFTPKFMQMEEVKTISYIPVD